MKITTLSALLLTLFIGQAALAQDQAKTETDGSMMYNSENMPPPGGGHMMQRGGPGMMWGGDRGMGGGHHMMFGDHTRMILKRLQPPTLLMRYQDKLKLTPAQIDAIKKEMKKFQSNVVDTEWNLQSATGKLKKALRDDNIDKDKTLSLLDKVMQAENSLKKQHLAMLISVHNVLAPEQRQELRRLCHHRFGKMRFHRQGGPMPMQKMDRGRF